MIRHIRFCKMCKKTQEFAPDDLMCEGNGVYRNQTHVLCLQCEADYRKGPPLLLPSLSLSPEEIEERKQENARVIKKEKIQIAAVIASVFALSGAVAMILGPILFPVPIAMSVILTIVLWARASSI